MSDVDAIIAGLSAADLERAVSAAAATWCGGKERETFMDDIRYFEANWRHFPGLTRYVEAAALALIGSAAKCAAMNSSSKPR